MNSGGVAAQLLQHYGYVGLAIGVFLNCLGIPIAAEVLLPLAGMLTRAAGLNFVAVVVVAVIAQVVGLFVAYLLARQGSTGVLERYGHLVLIDHAKLRRMHKLFKRHGTPLVAGGLYVPGVHGYMGYVAGFGGMRALLFFILDLTSNIIWTIALVGLGSLLANRIGGLTQVLNTAGIVMVALFVLSGLGIWYSKTHRT